MTTPLLPQVHVRLAAPVSLRLRVAPRPRPRVNTAPDPLTTRTFETFPIHLQIDAQARTLRAYLPPLPGSILLYSAADFAAACPDTMDDHAARILQLLGNDPAATLQALIDGTNLPAPPPRVPREIANWRAKAVLTSMGMLPDVEVMLAALPEPQKTIVSTAWAGDARFARRGATVLSIAAALGLTDAQLDSMFIQAEALEI